MRLNYKFRDSYFSLFFSLLLFLLLFLSSNNLIISKTNITTLKEIYDASTAQNGFDKYLELETGVTYTGGLFIGNIPNPENTSEILGDNGDDVRINGNGAILDLQGKEIVISFCDNSLEIEDCIILNGNVRYVGDHIEGVDYSPQGSVEYVTFYRPQDYAIVCLGAGTGITINRNIIVDAVSTGPSFQIYNGAINDLMPTGINIVSSANPGTFGNPVRTFNWSFHTINDVNSEMINHFAFLWEYGWVTPYGWDNAGGISYWNQVGLDPELSDPKNGDYSLSSTSPANGYGCQSFIFDDSANKSIEESNKIFSNNTNTIIGDDDQKNNSKSSIEISGSISENTVWDCDTVRVIGNLVVENGNSLTIDPGTRVEFMGYYNISVQGSMNSIGTAEDFITYTTYDPDQFANDSTQLGCWNGIKFDNTSSVNDSSKFVYSIFEYSKATIVDKVEKNIDDFDKFSGGVFYLNQFSKLYIANSIFRNNLAEIGGVISCFIGSSPILTNNLFHNNYALQDASVIYSICSYPEINSNTIVDNQVLDENIYHETFTIFSYNSKPRYTNNIIRDNEFNTLQISSNKLFYTYRNNIQEYEFTGNGNIDLDPLFDSNNSDNPYSLLSESPCINTGCLEENISDKFAINITNTDLAGLDRVNDEKIDMGAFEYFESNNIESNYELAISNYELNQNYPNPFNPLTRINYELRITNYTSYLS